MEAVTLLYVQAIWKKAVHKEAAPRKALKKLVKIQDEIEMGLIDSMAESLFAYSSAWGQGYRIRRRNRRNYNLQTGSYRQNTQNWSYQSQNEIEQTTYN